MNKNDEFPGVMIKDLINDLISYMSEYGNIPVCLMTSTDMNEMRLLKNSFVFELRSAEENDNHTETFVVFASCDDRDIVENNDNVDAD